MKKINFFYVMLLSGFIAICQNPQQLKDVYPGSTGSGIQQIVKTSNYTFFNADDDDVDLDRGLYRTDGTAGGTIKLNLTYPTYISTKAEKLTALGDKVVFAGDNSANYGEIWASNGTQGGTIALERFQPTASGVLPVKELKAMGTNVFYSVVDGNNHAVLKKTDGTPGGTSVVYDFSAYTGIPEVVYLTPLNNILYFVVYDAGGTGVDQLWRSDGTTGGTYMLMNFGTGQYLASFLMPAGNNIYAMIVKSGTGNVLWKSDGTVAGTVSVKTIGITGNNNYPHNAAIGSTLYFAGLDGNGKELWKTDGTEAGTMMVQNINAGAASSNPTLLTALNNNIYFYADGGINGNELWKFDGSSASEVLDIYPGSTGSKPLSKSSFQLGFVESNGTIVFNAANDATGQELWITDGTAANTKKIKDINPLGASNPSVLTPGNPVYFSANNGVNGAEIFKYDNSDGVLGLKNVWLTGSAFGEWKQSGVIKMTNNGGGIFTATNIQIVGDGKFKFTEGTWASAAGYSAIPGFPTGVTVVPGTDITGTLGFWNVTYNFVTKAYSFTPTPTDNWGVVGSATPNDWVGPDMPLTYDAISNKWSAVVSLNNGEIKFRNNNNWSVNYGDNDADGSLDTNGANIAIAGGRYLITLDFNTLKYSIKSTLVAIPDPNFEQALIDLGIDKDGVVNASISRSDAEAVIDLNLNGKNISSLAGIEHFVALRNLYCNDNSKTLTAINLGNKPNLINFQCERNAITSIDLSNCPNLEEFLIGGNKLTTLDVSNNSKLKSLVCSSNLLTTIDVSNNSNLNFIHVANNKLVNLNIANGNNLNFAPLFWTTIAMNALNNFSLSCIKVDSGIINTIPSNWSKDVTSGYSTDSCESLPIIYVNDTIQIGDVYTTTVGNDSNPGTAALPFETIQKAISRIAIGGVIYVDAGAYEEQLTINKGITIIGAGKELTSILKPATVVAPPGPFTEKGVIQTSQNIGDVFIEKMSITGGTGVTPVIIQSGGGVKNCNLQNGNQGIFFRIESGAKTAVVENNVINAEYIGVNFQGAGLTASLINNTISVANQGFSAGVFAGLDFGPLTQFTVTGNSINNYVTYGLLANSNNSNITQNSIVGVGGLAFSTNTSLQASCNWFGTKEAATIASRISGAVNYTPWLTNGTDSDIVSYGFQPLPDVCNGPLPLAITLDASANVTCKGTTNGTISITASDGLAPYSFLWTNSDNPEFSSSSEDLTNLAAGTYQLLLTDTNGSTVSLTNIVISEPDLLIASASGTNAICFGASNGTASVLADGGTAPYTYLWSNNETTEEITNLAAGIYSVTVTDANQCTAIANYEVTHPALLIATIANNSTICSNNATVTASAGTPGYTYMWSNGVTTTSINNVPTGTYSVVVTDANGCTTTASITLTVTEAFNPSASVINVSCFGASNGIITVTNANGTPPFTFSKDGGAFLNGSLPYSFNGLSAGTYNIAVKDANGCVGFVAKTISQPSSLNIILNTVQSSCYGQSTGAITVTVTGGTGALSYNWTGPNNFASSKSSINNLAAGNYSFTVIDNNGCTATLPLIVVPSLNEITVNAAVTNVLCRATLTGAINLTVTGGTNSGFTYSWTGALISTSEDLSNIGSANNYNVTITDIGSGCVITRSYSITQPASNLSLTAAKTNATGCSSMGTITATGSGGTSPYLYSKNGLDYQSTGLFTGLSGGNYTVWVKDASGCTITKAVSITDSGTDEFEGNNSKNQAKLISIGAVNYARIAVATDVADWFKFTIPSGSANYIVTLTPPNPSVSYSFNVYASGNNTPALVPSSFSTTTKQYLLAGGTTYYISITGGLSFDCYSLVVSSGIAAKTANPLVTNTKKEPIVVSTEILKVITYPNPHHGSFSLKIETPEDGLATVQLFTINGQFLAEKQVYVQKGNENSIPFESVSLGTILYRVQIGKNLVAGKVIGKE